MHKSNVLLNFNVHLLYFILLYIRFASKHVSRKKYLKQIQQKWEKVPRRSLRPTVQPETFPFLWAKSTPRATSSTTFGRRAFAIAGQLAYRTVFRTPVRNANSTEAAFRRLLWDILYARYYSTPSALGGVRRWCAVQNDTLSNGHWHIEIMVKVNG